MQKNYKPARCCGNCKHVNNNNSYILGYCDKLKVPLYSQIICDNFQEEEK